ncbi:MAG TPA: ATP synthase subunit I [Desulfobacterales bacterium]|nr:ATP synthase subunit I [Desulfobacterales bacterium]
MKIQQRILRFITRANWILLGMASIGGLLVSSFDFVLGIIFGGLIVTINFHMLYRTLKRSLTPPYLSSHNVVIAKYYVRFIVSGFIIFVLISKHFVNPLGLIIGLSVVVVSVILATFLEFKRLIFEEAI